MLQHKMKMRGCVCVTVSQRIQVHNLTNFDIKFQILKDVNGSRKLMYNDYS